MNPIQTITQIETQPFLKNRHGKHLNPDYHKNYYLLNRDKKLEAAKKRSKAKYVPRPRKAFTPFKEKQLQKFIFTFGLNRQVVLERLSREKGKKEVWKGIYGNFDAFQILKDGKNYIIRLGIKNSYRDYYIGCIDIDGRGHTKIATENNTTYIKTKRGIHIFFLYEKKIGNKNVKLRLGNGVERKSVSVDFIINSYVLGVGSKHDEGTYDLKGRGWNFYLGVFKSDVEALNWFVNKYQAEIVYKKAQKRTDNLNKEFNLEAQIEQRLDNWHIYKHIWQAQKNCM